ncbi:hypothetical protein EOT10_39830 [Streptomyces antnestii]|uniref:Uncharacterized protein n=1 Tax=Streptomyces antnestii TaxID=2494256 RepID=A0A437NYM6_9ACTN|nr:hypothetical protein [Streptomyces sp. San01]RVU15132.1 hypothetical protein EOT10_39830 [Streptomyces sp. San01]
MRDTFSHPHPARRATVTLVAVLVLTAAVLAVLWLGVPDCWWPQTGKAFAAGHTTLPAPASAAPANDPCDLIVGPAKAYCLRSSHIPPTQGALCRAGALLVAPALLGFVILLNRRRRQS